MEGTSEQSPLDGWERVAVGELPSGRRVELVVGGNERGLYFRLDPPLQRPAADRPVGQALVGGVQRCADGWVAWGAATTAPTVTAVGTKGVFRRRVTTQAQVVHLDRLWVAELPAYADELRVVRKGVEEVRLLG